MQKRCRIAVQYLCLATRASFKSKNESACMTHICGGGCARFDISQRYDTFTNRTKSSPVICNSLAHRSRT